MTNQIFYEVDKNNFVTNFTIPRELCFEFDKALAIFIACGLEQLAKDTNGYPASYADKYGLYQDEGMYKWVADLKELAAEFRAYGECTIEDPTEEQKNSMLDKLKEVYMDLWW